MYNNNNNNNQPMEESEGMELDLTVGSLDPLQYQQPHLMLVHPPVSLPHHHHYHPHPLPALSMDHHWLVILYQAMVKVENHRGFHIRQLHQSSVQPQIVTVSLLVEIPHHQDPPQQALNMHHLLSVILKVAMVEVEDHHQDHH